MPEKIPMTSVQRIKHISWRGADNGRSLGQAEVYLWAAWAIGVSGKLPETDNRSHGCLIINVWRIKSYSAAGPEGTGNPQLFVRRSRRQRFLTSRSTAPASRNYNSITETQRLWACDTHVGLLCSIVKVPSLGKPAPAVRPIWTIQLEFYVYVIAHGPGELT